MTAPGRQQRRALAAAQRRCPRAGAGNICATSAFEVGDGMPWAPSCACTCRCIACWTGFLPFAGCVWRFVRFASPLCAAQAALENTYLEEMRATAQYISRPGFGILVSQQHAR